MIRKLVDSKIYDLGQPHFEGMPVHPADPPFVFQMHRTHAVSEKLFEGGAGFAHETIFSSMHAGSHIDSLAHVARNGKLFGGIEAASVTTPLGMKKHGIEEAPIFVSRGILLDVASAKNENSLSEEYGITASDLASAAKFTDVEVRKGDVVLIRTGYGKFFSSDKSKYLGNHPGINLNGARWLAEHQIALTGADNLAYEVLPTDSYSVHVHMIAESGIFLMKNLNLEQLSKDQLYEFPFICIPLKLVGGTGSFIRPVALGFG